MVVFWVLGSFVSRPCSGWRGGASCLFCASHALCLYQPGLVSVSFVFGPLSREWVFARWRIVCLICRLPFPGGMSLGSATIIVLLLVFGAVYIYILVVLVLVLGHPFALFWD